MSTPRNPYDWTPEEVQAAWQAYANAPDTATKAELEAVMDEARASVREDRPIVWPWARRG